MNAQYILMHKNVPFGLVEIDSDSGAMTHCRISEPEYSPFPGKTDVSLIKIWWEHRAVPGHRKDMEQVIRNAGCINSKEYLAKNLALSITDTYWLCPVEIDLAWEDVSLYNFHALGIEIMPYHNLSSYDPNASLGGEMDKYWDLSSQPPTLVKRAYAHHGQQNANEMFASELHRRQENSIDYVQYHFERANDGGTISKCRAFTSERVEFVPAYEIIMSRKSSNNTSKYETFIDVCAEHGLDREEVQRFLDYQTLTDFAISNTDEHLRNFGVLRDTETLEFLKPAPIFDSGNSMFYDIDGVQPLSTAQLLDRKINAVQNSEEKMLRHVHHRNIAAEDRLPEPKEAEEFYCRCGIPEEKARFIAGSYENKLQLLRRFQSGEQISLYNEKKREL